MRKLYFLDKKDARHRVRQKQEKKRLLIKIQQICSCNAGVFFWQAKVPWGLANISYFALHCMQHKVVLLVVLMVIRCRFFISSTQFLSIMFWVKTPFQIGDNITAFFHFLCVTFH